MGQIIERYGAAFCLFHPTCLEFAPFQIVVEPKIVAVRGISPSASFFFHTPACTLGFPETRLVTQGENFVNLS